MPEVDWGIGRDRKKTSEKRQIEELLSGHLISTLVHCVFPYIRLRCVFLTMQRVNSKTIRDSEPGGIFDPLLPVITGILELGAQARLVRRPRITTGGNPDA